MTRIPFSLAGHPRPWSSGRSRLRRDSARSSARSFVDLASSAAGSGLGLDTPEVVGRDRLPRREPVDAAVAVTCAVQRLRIEAPPRRWCPYGPARRSLWRPLRRTVFAATPPTLPNPWTMTRAPARDSHATRGFATHHEHAVAGRIVAPRLPPAISACRLGPAGGGLAVVTSNSVHHPRQIFRSCSRPRGDVSLRADQQVDLAV